jgi:uncharacterized membrane protein
MNTYNINKGIGRTVEFKDWKRSTCSSSQVVLLRMLILIMILYMTGVNSYLCLFIGIGGGSLLVWQTFSLNKSTVNMVLMRTKKRHPRYIICRKPVHRYFQLNLKCINMK